MNISNWIYKNYKQIKNYNNSNISNYNKINVSNNKYYHIRKIIQIRHLSTDKYPYI